MNAMNTSSFSTIALLVAGTLLAGCQPKTELPTLAGTVIVGPEYSENKGLYVPEDTRLSLGLKVIEITEQSLAATHELSLYTYGKNGGALLASGRIAPAQAATVKAGQTLRVQTPDGQELDARVTGLKDLSTSGAGWVEILVEIAAPSSLTAGSFVTAHVTQPAGVPVPTIPRSALVRATDGYFVYTVSGEHYMRTPVIPGVLTADAAEIKDGLYAGDQIVSEPVMALWMTELAAVKGGHACCAIPGETL
ncbi:hypothetical protein OPIT5_27285 [Opitutaceae bacterium TAV5]|nr:hypothetical protein OPIT5_27285 [Opitutaceae bacterium TAV5]